MKKPTIFRLVSLFLAMLTSLALSSCAIHRTPIRFQPAEPPTEEPTTEPSTEPTLNPTPTPTPEEDVTMGKESKAYPFTDFFSKTVESPVWTATTYAKTRRALTKSFVAYTSSDGGKLTKSEITPAAIPLVMTFTAPEDGFAAVEGMVESLDLPADAYSDGITATILHNGKTVWLQKVRNGFALAHSFTLTLTAGDTLDFVVSGGEDLTANAAFWQPTVTYNRQPEVLLGNTDEVMSPADYRLAGQIMSDSSTGFALNPDGSISFYTTSTDDITKYTGTLEHPSEVVNYKIKQSTLPNPSDASGQWWLLNIYQDFSRGGLLGFSHIEMGSKGRTWGLGLMYSWDNGESWTKLGVIVEQQTGNPMTANILGTPYIVKDGYLQIYYYDYNGIEFGMATARAKLDDVLAAAYEGKVTEWRKYYNGAWDEPGIRGRFSNLIEKSRTLDGDWAVHGDAAYSSYLGAYLLTGYNHSAGKGVWISFSRDGLHWTDRVWIQRFTRATASLSPYESVVSADGSDNGYVYKDFYLYYNARTGGDDPDGELHWMRTAVTLNYHGVQNLLNELDRSLAAQTETEWDSLSDFAAAQNENDWGAMQQNATAAAFMSASGTQFTGIGRVGANNMTSPAGDDLAWVARTWTAKKDGWIRVSGSARSSAGGHFRVNLRNTVVGSQGWVDLSEGEYRFDFVLQVHENDLLFFTLRGEESAVSISYAVHIASLESYSGEVAVGTVLPQDLIESGSHFTAVQGEDGFSYRAWKNGRYQLLTWDAVNYRWSIPSSYCIVAPSYQHPDGYDSVRTWTCSETGTYRVTVEAEAIGGKSSDGVKVSLRHNGEIVLDPILLTADNPKTKQTVTITLAVGDTVDLHVNQNGTILADTTNSTLTLRKIG